jgi:sulfite exporter TauE/SafE
MTGEKCRFRNCKIALFASHFKEIKSRMKRWAIANMVKFQVHTAANTKKSIFWGAVPCSLVENDLCLKGFTASLIER